MFYQGFDARLRESISSSVETRYSLIEDEIGRQETAGTAAGGAGNRPKARYSAVFFATEDLALLHARCGRYGVGNRNTDSTLRMTIL